MDESIELGFWPKMEVQENKKRKVRETEPSSSSLPLDVVSKILSKLPSKSVLRSRGVSKLWSSISTDHYFLSSFITQPRLLLFFKEGDKFSVFLIPQPNTSRFESYSCSFPIDSYNITFPKQCTFTVKTESVHGLICFQKSAKPVVWNPSLRTFKHFSKPEKSWNKIIVFLGYDPIEGKHKVMCLPRLVTCNECRVLTVGSDQKEAWRTVKTNLTHRVITSHHNPTVSTGFNGRCINGVLYYKAILDNKKHVIMRFDVRSEKFDMVAMPSWVNKNNTYWNMDLIPYEGRLSLVGYNKHGTKMWVLEDAEKSQWCTHTFLSLSNYDEGWESFKLIGITVEGELIYVPRTLFKVFHILYVDPKRETLRRVRYKGVVDNEFRQRNGLGDKHLRSLQYYPNHFETLMSL